MKDLELFLEVLFQNIKQTEESTKEKNDLYQYLVESIEDKVREGESLLHSIESAVEQFNTDEFRSYLEQTYNQGIEFQEVQSLGKTSMVFENVLKLKKDSLSKVLNRITDIELITKAIYYGNKTLREKIHSSVSEFMASLIKDCENYFRDHPPNTSSVEKAQCHFISVMKEMMLIHEIESIPEIFEFKTPLTQDLIDYITVTHNKNSFSTFEDIVKLSNRDFQLVLSRIHNHKVVVNAIQNTPLYLREKFFSCMPNFRCDIVLEEEKFYEHFSCAQKDIEEARKVVTDMVLKMIKNHQISF